MTAYRDQVDAQRAARAAALATDLVADLARMADQPDMIVEDTICERLGTLLDQTEQAPLDERVGLHRLVDAVVSATESALASALADTTERPDAWHAPWRILAALTRVLPYPLSDDVDDALARLREREGGRILPAAPKPPTVCGSVLWTRDRYGSRFAVAAPITVRGRAIRWYLWDIDACGHQALTVHSGFYPTSEAALVAWQDGVGEVAAAGTVLAPVDDPWLLAELMPVEEGLLHAGGENAEQFAEYHRSKRLGEIVKRAVPRPETQPGKNGNLDAATAAVEFAAWLRTQGTGEREMPDDLDELTTELADSWCISGIDAVFATCSPHRVALCVPHMRDFYLDEFADQLMALLPEWTRWLAAHNGTSPELADRCLPYAHNQPHPQVGQDNSRPHYLARVIE